MSAFSGRQATGVKVGRNKGVMRAHKTRKRLEAEARNAAYQQRLAVQSAQDEETS